MGKTKKISPKEEIKRIVVSYNGAIFKFNSSTTTPRSIQTICSTATMSSATSTDQILTHVRQG